MKGLIVAIQFLTRLPTPRIAVSGAEFATSMRWFPAVGLIVGAIVALAKPKAPTKNEFGERSMSIQTGGARWVASPESSEGEDEPPSPGGTPKRTQSMRI